MAWKDGLATDEAAEKVLRSHLIRCHSTIALDFPEIAEMGPADAADYLLHLRKTKRIRIELTTDSEMLIRCKITDVAGPGGGCEPGR